MRKIKAKLKNFRIFKRRKQKKSAQFFVRKKIVAKIKQVNTNLKFKKPSVNFRSLPFPEYEVISKDKTLNPNANSMLQEQQNKIKKHAKKKNFSIWFLLINLAVIAGIFIYNALTGGVSDIHDLFTGETYWRYLFVGIGLFALLMVLESLKITQLIYRNTGRIRFWTGLKTQMMGKYYDCITPMSTGGQPFQVFYLKRRGIRADVATSIPLAKYIIGQFVFVIVSVCILIFKSEIFMGKGIIVSLLAWVCLILNAGLISVVLLLSLTKKFGPRIIMSFIKFGYKLKIVKNYTKTFRKVLRFVREYQLSMKNYIRHLPTMIVQVVLAFATLSINALIPFFIYKAFNPFGTVPALEIMVNVIVCEMVASLFPLPGGSGAAELSFAAVFKQYFPSNFLVWALVMWRIVTYYGYIIIGAIVLGYDTVWGNRKNDALVKSGVFKEKPRKKEVFRVDNKIK